MQVSNLDIGMRWRIAYTHQHHRTTASVDSSRSRE